MRTTGTLLLLLAIVGMMVHPQIDPQQYAPADRATSAGSSVKDEWRYSRQAPFHDYLDHEAQQYSSTEPGDAAQRVCAELGGEAGFVEAATPSRMQVGFLCRFTEPDVTMHVDFGDLDRIPAR